MAKPRKDYVWKDPSRLKLALCIVMGLNIAVNLMSFAIDGVFGPAAVYGDAGDFTGPQVLRWMADMFEAIVLLLCLVAPLWILQVSRNAHTFKPGLKNTPFGAVIWYVVPFASFFKPYEAMSEIWAASSSPGEGAKDGILNWWWGFFLLGSLVGGVSARLPPPVDIPARMVSDLLAIAGSVIFIQLVRRLSRMQIDKQTIWMTFGDSGPRQTSALEQVSN